MVPVNSLVALFRRRACWIVFAVLAVLIVGIRWNYRFEPLERDITAYAVIGQELLTGRPLYSDLWDHKPPGVHLIFAGATAIVGPGVPAVLLVNVVLSLALLGALMMAARAIGGSRCAIICGVLWTFVGGDLGLQANQPNVELAINLCIALALSISLLPQSRKTGRVPAVTGLLTAASILLKPVAVAQFGALAAVELSDRWMSGNRKETVSFLGRWLGCAVAGVTTVMTWAVLRGGFEPVWDAVVRYNLAYTRGNLFGNLVEMARIGTHLPLESAVIIGLLALPAIEGCRVMAPPQRHRILAVLVGSAIAVAAPGRFFPHYYQLLLPPLVVAAAAGLSHLLDLAGAKKTMAFAVLLMVTIIEVASYRYSPEQWSRQKYGEEFLNERSLATQLQSHLDPGEAFWQLGTSPGLYLLTKTVPASGVLYDNPLREGSPVKDRLGARVIADLSRAAPRWVVVRNVHDDRGIMQWLRENYRRAEVTLYVERFSLWTRRESTTPESPSGVVFSDDFEAGRHAGWISSQVGGR